MHQDLQQTVCFVKCFCDDGGMLLLTIKMAYDSSEVALLKILFPHCLCTLSHTALLFGKRLLYSGFHRSEVYTFTSLRMS